MTPKLKHDLKNIYTSLRVAYDLLAAAGSSKAVELLALGLDRLKEVGDSLDRPSKAQDVIQALQLVPLPGEGGFFRQTYIRPAKDGLPSSTAIFYLVTPESYSALHRLKHDEIFHFYCGDPVEMLQIDSGKKHKVRLGSDVMKGDSPQVVVKANVWQGTQLVSGGSWALLGTTMSPGFESFEMADRKQLLEAFPHYEADIISFTRSPKS